MERVDKFKENLLFEEFKDTPLRSAKGLFNDIKKKYDYEPSSDLYKKIVNYQIEKYGSPLLQRGKIRPNFGVKRKDREYRNEWGRLNYHANKVIERSEKDGRRKRKKHL